MRQLIRFLTYFIKMKLKELKYSLFLLEKIKENVLKNEILSLYLLDEFEKTKQILEGKINDELDKVSE